MISDRGYRNFRKARRRHTSMPVQVLLITEDKKFRANSFCSYEEYAPLQFTSGTFEDADCSIGIPPSSPSVSANSRSTSEMTWNHPQGATHTTKLYRDAVADTRYSPQRPSQRMLVEALTTPVDSALEGQYRRRDRAIDAITAYCLVKEGLAARHCSRPAGRQSSTHCHDVRLHQEQKGETEDMLPLR